LSWLKLLIKRYCCI